MTGFRHKKRFGQHFLKNQSILATIASYGELGADNICIEIGPGQGALTQYLLDTGASVIAIELDQRLEARLRKLERKQPTFNLVMGDALESDLLALAGGRKFSLISNLPYEISTPLLFKLTEYTSNIDRVVLLLQQEVVQRMCAQVGTSSYGRLSVMSQYYFDCEALIEVDPEAFSPPPKVMSQVVMCRPREREDVDDEQAFAEFVRKLFVHRRKMIRHLFKGSISEGQWQQLSIEPTDRPQSLSVKAIVTLYSFCIENGTLPKSE